ncbi:MAG TPA: DUF4870 domain-containing protein [Thermoanaerobaculia bacterium]|nr:DUF4870 domain-containing protein [Thermoanaerobaculia bacterium]
MSEPSVPPPPSYTPPPPPPPGGMPPVSGSTSPNRGLMIVLSYLWLLALIPLLVEKDDREVQWHAKNGLLLTGAEVVIGILLSIFTSMVAFLDLGCTGCILHSALFVVILVVHIMAIVKGVNGQRLVIPGLSQYVDRF